MILMVKDTKVHLYNKKHNGRNMFILKQCLQFDKEFKFYFLCLDEEYVILYISPEMSITRHGFISNTTEGEARGSRIVIP